MSLKNYRFDLRKRLRDPQYAAEYHAQVPTEKDSAAFLIALKEFVGSGGGVVILAGHGGLKWPSLCKIPSKNGNSTVATFQVILEPLGLCISAALVEAA
jgi:DNA-binding phage protein